MGGSDTTTQENEPWGPQGDYLKEIFSRASNLGNIPREYYGGQTTPNRSIGASGATEQANYLMQQGGASGAASDYAQRVFGSEFLDPSTAPGFEDQLALSMGDATRYYQNSIAPGLSMGSMGRSGSGAEQARTRNAGNDQMDRLFGLAQGARYGHYSDERGRQNAMAGMAPGIDAGVRGNQMQAYAMGEGQERFDRARMQDDMNRSDFARDEEWTRLGLFRDNIVGDIGLAPGKTQSTQTTDPTSSILGGVTSLIGLLSMFSSRAMKHEIDVADTEEALAQLAKLPIAIWKYRNDIEGVSNTDPMDHIGPYAEDVQQLFGIGDGVRISMIDLHGIGLAAIQELLKRVVALEQKLLPQPLALAEEA